MDAANRTGMVVPLDVRAASFVASLLGYQYNFYSKGDFTTSCNVSNDHEEKKIKVRVVL